MRKKVIFIQLTKSTSFALHKIDYKVMWTTRSLLQENILHKHEKKHSIKLLDWTNNNYILHRFHCTLSISTAYSEIFNNYYAVLQVQMNWEL